MSTLQALLLVYFVSAIFVAIYCFLELRRAGILWLYDLLGAIALTLTPVANTAVTILVVADFSADWIRSRVSRLNNKGPIWVGRKR